MTFDDVAEECDDPRFPPPLPGCADVPDNPICGFCGRETSPVWINDPSGYHMVWVCDATDCSYQGEEQDENGVRL
jgi:hypothetical protein